MQPENSSTTLLEITRVHSKGATHQAQSFEDCLAVEEPLEIRIEYGALKRKRKSISITMRTPGSDFELAAGFLFTEGLLTHPEQLLKIEFCGPTGNVVRLDLEPGVEIDLKRLERNFYTSSSCGVCGKSSIEALRTQNLYSLKSSGQSSDKTNTEIYFQTIHTLSAKLRERQELFESTGGLHGCGLFDLAGNFLCSREDVGRHNALDKLIGHYFLKGKLPLNNHILMVSGRASFELIQKAAMAGIKIFVAVGAPSSLAVALATEMNMTLIGFAREQKFNIYTGHQRIEKGSSGET